MGRVKKYNRQKESKRRRSASVAKKLGQRKQDSDSDMDVDTKRTQGSLSIAKKRQIFKKSKEGRRDVKKRIAELKLQSKKLTKRNLD